MEGTSGSATTVLVVDDDEAVLSVVCRALAHAGYDVRPASTGPEALDEARRVGDALDLLVTDVVMPGMGGRELAETLREERPQLAVLFMSAFTEDDVIREGVRVAEVRFLPKPFTLESLVDAVRSALDDV